MSGAFGENVTKYKARATIVDGIRFASLKESRRYQELKLLERVGEIAALQLQPRFSIDIDMDARKHVCYFVADFSYFSKESQKRIVEDCKGYRTPVYRLKKKLMKAVLGIEILET